MFSNTNFKLSIVIAVITNNKIRVRFSSQELTSFKTLSFTEEINEINPITFLHIFHTYI